MTVFIDTSVFVAYYNKRDVHHERAVSILKEIDAGKHGKVFTSDYVFDEAVTVVLVRTKSVEKAIKLGEHLLKSDIDLLKVNSYVFREAWDLFKKVKMSFTDCTNIVFMKIFGIGKIATFDEGFKKIPDIKVI